jgi:hypothetical protein
MGEDVSTLRPATYPRVTEMMLGERKWHVTENGRTRPDVGERTGWVRHAVDKHNNAACGLKPRLGWGIDIAQDDMPVCARCAVTMGACPSCKGCGRMMRETSPRSWTGEPCAACHRSGEAHLSKLPKGHTYIKLGTPNTSGVYYVHSLKCPCGRGDGTTTCTLHEDCRQCQTSTRAQPGRGALC